jgi:uracil-DNA glycosylase family 4
VPAWGDPLGRILLVGLAPAAHGGNRTGRIFTGDESGNFLFRALHAAGLSNRPVSEFRGDATRLTGAVISAACRCAPPDNKPLPEELANCFPYLSREAALLARPRVFVALGALAFRACLSLLAAEGARLPRPRPRFAHGAACTVGEDRLLASYHPSQQNTFTGKLTLPMLSAVLERAVREARRASRPATS